MKATRLLLLAALAGAMLAGCSGKDPVPEGIPIDDRGAALPTVHGFVVDEAIRPLVGVEVRFLGTDIRTTTDDAGAYEIFEPVDAAKSILVTAYKAGFWPRTQHVQISGYVSARLDFGLETNPYLIPHVEVIETHGTLDCKALVTAAGPPQGLNCTRPNPTSDETPTPWRLWLNPSPGFTGVVVQLQWNAESPMSEHLHATLRAPVAGGMDGSPGEVQVEVTGASPLRLEIPADVARTFNVWTSVVLEVALADSQPGTPVSFARGQLFEAFSTLFYVDPAPPGYMLT